MDGKLIAIFSDKGRLAVVEPAFWKMVESNCVAVLTEKHTVHHKLRAEPPSFDDRSEWDDVVPERTLKLRCTAEAGKK